MSASLTPAEQAALTCGADRWQTAALPAHGIRALWLSDGPHGVRRETAPDVSWPATCFPTASALGATWDRDLVRRVGAALGREAADAGVDVLLGPGVNLKRTPRCGRNFEYLSEDPLLSGELGVAYVEGVQAEGTSACVKHFVGNEQERWRHSVSAEVDERTLREVYLRPFERVVRRARPDVVMCAYNRVNGTYASEHAWLLTTVLRQEWGFGGVVVSDWGAVRDRVVSLRAGLDLMMPADDGEAAAAVVAALGAGDLAPEVLATAATRVIALHERAVARSPRGAGPGPVAPQTVPAEHAALAREAAAAAVVVLRHDGALLPLDPGRVRRVAVLGALAVGGPIQGGGSADVNPAVREDLVPTLREALPGARVDVAAGQGDGEDGLGTAVRLAQGSDVALVVVGSPPGHESEGYDRASVDLPADQTALVEAVLATGTPTVVAVVAGSATLLGDWEHDAAALLHTGFGGQAAGAGLADVLVGAAEPRGRLAETIPLAEQDVPGWTTYPGERGQVRYAEGVLVGHRWYDATGRGVRYPFGHGLGWTTFEHEAVGATATSTGVRVEVDVVNTGPRPGTEVVQVYAEGPPAPVRRPPRELVGFAVVRLAPGERRRVRVDVEADDLAYVDVVDGVRRRQPGTWRFVVGRSSRDLRGAAEVDLVADPATPAPVDDEALDAALRARPGGGPTPAPRT